MNAQPIRLGGLKRTLQVVHLERAARFYEKLGFTPFRATKDQRSLLAPADAFLLVLTIGNQPGQLQLELPDLAIAHRALGTDGSSGEADSVVATDPFGNTLLISRREPNARRRTS